MARIPVAVRAALAAGALLASAASARAGLQDGTSETASLDRLKFEYKCVFDISDWRGKGAEEVFLARLQAQRAAYTASKDARLPELEDLLAEGFWLLKTEFEARGDHDRASGYAGEVMKIKPGGPRTKELARKAEEYIVERNYAAADAALKAGNKEEAKAKYRTLLETTKGPEAAAVLFRLDYEDSGYDAVAAKSDLDAELEVLGRLVPSLEATLGPGLAAQIPRIKELRDRRDSIERETQRFSAKFFDTSAAVAGVKVGQPVALDLETATFAFLPLEGGGRYPGQGVSAAIPKDKPLRLYRGTYDIRVYAPGQKGHSAAFVREVLGDKPLEIQIPTRVPEGMVYTPPPAPGRTDALFCDRIEVTVGQVAALGASGKGLKETVAEGKGDNDLPAWIIDESAAREFEKESGKRIPTEAQWHWMAFGPYGTGRQFPWGDESPTGERVFVDPAAKEPVARKAGGREKGASCFGLEDMAGNLAEWVRREGDRLWLLGGHNGMQYEQLGAFEERNPLRDPMPGTEVYKGMTTEEQNFVRKYWFNTESDWAYATGLRMVVPVTAPPR